MEGVVLGATGLIGEQLVRQLLKDPAFLIVRTLVRKPLNLEHPKLLQQVTDFSNLEEFKEKLGTGTVIFCCVGTTMKKVKGDKDAYRKVDFDIPVHAARFGSENGFRHYCLVSAIGANIHSSNFYLQLKGQVEEEIKNFSFSSVHIFRPSILLGPREESRPAEQLFKKISSAVSFLLPARYKPIQARDVASSMINAVKKYKSGVRIYEWKQMMRLISRD